MLSSATISAMLPVVEMDRAKRFYGETLGLTPSNEAPGGIYFKSNDGSKLFLYPRAATKADHTAAGFEVQDIEAEVRELKAKGVVFEELDTPDIKTVNSIATWGKMKAAWFKDTEGNILGLAYMG